MTDRAQERTGAGESSPALAAALEYAALGWAVLPLKVDKAPRTLRGLSDASTDVGQLISWWTRWPDAGVGVRTGSESGLLALDVDPDHGGSDSLAELEHRHGPLPETVRCETGGGGEHHYFKHPGGELRNTAGKLGAGLDTRADGGYVVAPPSPHSSGGSYTWDLPPDETDLAEPPSWLLKALRGGRNGKRRKCGDTIPSGKRNAELASLAGTMRRRGMDETAIAAALRETNRRRCDPPLPDEEVEAIASSVARYEPADATPDIEPRELADVLEVFQRHLYLPDPGFVVVTLGAVAANYLDGDPVWLVGVGPPGSGKTESLQAVAALSDVYPTATLTEPALLSGTPQKDRGEGSHGGLLRSIGGFGVILCKDFGSVLSLHRDARSQVLAALREVYDGEWTRHVGTDGGKTLSWSGKVGLLAGATQSLDRHHAVMSSMGERFVIYRLPAASADAQAARALAGAGSERVMRQEISEAVLGLFRDGLPYRPMPLDDEGRERLILYATFAVRARSAVERDGYRREIELIPQPEAPARLVKVLARMLAGLDALGNSRDASWHLVAKLALDSVPEIRVSVIDLLHGTDGMKTADVATGVRHPTATTRRVLEDLAAHSLVEREAGGQGKADIWYLSEWCRDRYGRIAQTLSETSDGTDIAFSEPSEGASSPHSSPLRMEDDTSEKVADGGAPA